MTDFAVLVYHHLFFVLPGIESSSLQDFPLPHFGLYGRNAERERVINVVIFSALGVP